VQRNLQTREVSEYAGWEVNINQKISISKSAKSGLKIKPVRQDQNAGHTHYTCGQQHMEN